MSRHQKAKPGSNGAQRSRSLPPDLPPDMPPEMKAIAAMAQDAGMSVGGGVTAPEEPTAGEDQQQLTDPAVLIVRIPGEAPGQYNIQIAEMNGLDPFAVPALLKLAAKVKNLQLGLKEEE